MENQKTTFIITREDRGIDPATLNTQALRIGSQIDCELVLNHPTVSHLHAGINEVEGRFYIINLSPSTGTGPQALQSPAHARGWARATLDELRSLTRRHDGTVHLFLFASVAGAVLLGNLWNRMPTTQLYDDLGPGRGYAPTFLLPG